MSKLRFFSVQSEVNFDLFLFKAKLCFFKFVHLFLENLWIAKSHVVKDNQNPVCHVDD